MEERSVGCIKPIIFLCRLYVSPEILKYDYRVLHIDNYSLFYAVENKKIEIHRIIYSRRDTERVIKAQERKITDKDNIVSSQIFLSKFSFDKD